MNKKVITLGISLLLLTAAPLSVAANEAQVSPSQITFNDVSKSHWSSSAIQWGLDNQIVSGYPDGSFRPNKNVTQSEFLAMLIKAYEATPTNFQQSDLWDTPFLDFARKNNWSLVTNLTAGQIFNRGQVAKVLTNASGKNYNLDDSIHYLLDAGLSNGKTERSIAGYKANDRLTRAEAISFIKNIHEKLDKLSAAPVKVDKYSNPDSDIKSSFGNVIPLQKIQQKLPATIVAFRETLKPFKVNNIEYTPSINDISGAMGIETNYVLNGKYLTFNAQFAVDDNYSHDFLGISIYSGRTLLYSGQAVKGQNPQTIEIDLRGIDEIMIRAENYIIQGGSNQELQLGFGDQSKYHETVHIYDISLTEKLK